MNKKYFLLLSLTILTIVVANAQILVLGTVANNGGVSRNVSITGNAAGGGTVTIQSTTDLQGNFGDTLPGPLVDSSMITASVTDCNGHTNSNSVLYSVMVSYYTVALDYCPPKPIQALFTYAQATVGGNPVPGHVVITDMSTGSNLNYLWDFGDGSTSTLQNPTHSYSTNGPFTLCLTVSDTGYTDTYCDTLSVDSSGMVMKGAQGFTIHVGEYSPATGITESVNQEFTMYPNPAQDKLYIVSGEMTGSQVEILDISGRVVLSENLSSTQNVTEVNLSGLNTGVFFVKVSDRAHTAVQRLVITE